MMDIIFPQVHLQIFASSVPFTLRSLSQARLRMLSFHSFTSFSTTVTTLTGQAGCSVTDAFLQPLPVKKTNKKRHTQKRTASSNQIDIHFVRSSVYCATQPPSTMSEVPVVNFAASDAR